MKIVLLFLLISSVVLFNLADSSKSIKVEKAHRYSRKLVSAAKPKIKTVHYAIKRDNEIHIKTVTAKDLSIDPFADWAAKALWNGNDYNSTG